MSDQFSVALPKYLEAAYRAGEIIITGGVARYADSGKIAAHLEQIAPSALNCFGVFNPYSSSFQTVTGVVNTAQLNHITSLIQQLQSLSYINILMSGATLGISIVGFAVVLRKMDELDKKIDQLSSQLQVIDVKVSDLHKNEMSKLIEDARRRIRNCKTLIRKLEGLGDLVLIPNLNAEISNSDEISGKDKLFAVNALNNLDIEISKLLDYIESSMERIIDQYIDRDNIKVPLDLSQCLYSSYANLLKTYMTTLYLYQKDLKLFQQNLTSLSSSRLEVIKSFSNKLSSSVMMDAVYEQHLFNQERRFSEDELDTILKLYRAGCKHVSQEVHNHHEIMTTTPLEKFKEWRNLLQASSKEPFVWVEH